MGKLNVLQKSQWKGRRVGGFVEAHRSGETRTPQHLGQGEESTEKELWVKNVLQHSSAEQLGQKARLHPSYICLRKCPRKGSKALYLEAAES